MVGDKIGNYRVVRKIGEGGMGAVYEAVHEKIGRHVAIKVLHREHSANPEVLARFHNEARAVNLVTHPSLVDVYEVGELADGSAFIVMQYLQGESLGERMQRQGGRMDRGQTLRFIRQIASAMVAAHHKGIIHRDLKPNNVMLVADPETVGGERVKVLDFGIAKMVAGPEATAGAEVKTHVGTILGTPAYMSPEQCHGAAAVTEKADVYSLGVMLYEALVGRKPFVGNSVMALLGMHMTVPPPPIEKLDPSLPPELSALVHGMLAKDPDERPSMQKVAERLEQLGAPSGRRNRRTWLVMMGSALILSGVAAGLFGLRSSPLPADLTTPRPDLAPPPDLLTPAPPDLLTPPPPDLATPNDLAGPQVGGKHQPPHHRRKADDITDDAIRVVE